MSNVQDLAPRGRRIGRKRARASLFLVGVGVFAPSNAPAAIAAPAVKPTVTAGFTIKKVADAPQGASNCDDLAFLHAHLFMGCENKTLNTGGSGESTLVEVTLSGALLRTWSIKHQINGLAGDPLTHQVIVSLDENKNPLMATVTPSAPASQQVTYYKYSPNPDAAATPSALRTGGGTNHVSVDAAGHVLVTASNAQRTTGTAVFQVALTPPSSPSRTGTAALSPTFLDNAIAKKANHGTGTVTLHLRDLDSAAIVPESSPRFGGSYVTADQTESELVFANNIFNGTGLTVLKTPHGLDDLLWTTKPAGTLYVVDHGAPAQLPKTAISTLWKVTGPFTTNTVLASNDGVSDEVVKVNLTTGALRPLIRHLNTAKGLVYLNPDGSPPQLTLKGAATVPVSTKTTSTSTAARKSSGSSLCPDPRHHRRRNGAAHRRQWPRDHAPQIGS